MKCQLYIPDFDNYSWLCPVFSNYLKYLEAKGIISLTCKGFRIKSVRVCGSVCACVYGKRE